MAEISDILHLIPGNKVQGLNRLTIEFYCTFWDVLHQDLTGVWAESEGDGEFLLPCRRAVLALLPKK